MQAEEKTLFDRVDEKSRQYKAVLSDRFRRNLSYVVLLCVLALTVVIPFATLSVVPFWSAAFLADTMYMTLCTYTAYLLFLPMGKNSGKAKSLSYFPTLERWSALSEEVRGRGALSAFSAYCGKQMEAERAEEQIRLVQAACVEPSEFRSVYVGVRGRALSRLMRERGLSRRQRRLLHRALRGRRVRTIEPTRILCGAARATINDAGRSGISYETRQIVKKPIFCMLLSFLLAGVVIYPTGSVGVGVLFTIVARVTGVMLSVCSGFSTGVNAVAAETEQMRMRILFLSAFAEQVEGTK